MKTYWEMDNIEKGIYIKKIISSSRKQHSLSNSVFLTNEIVIKDGNSSHNSKFKNESKILKKNGIRHEIISNYLVMEKRAGKNATINEVNDSVLIKDLVKTINFFSKMEKDGIEKHNFLEKLKNNEVGILSFLMSNDISSDIFKDSINILSNEVEEIVSHNDLNENNILYNADSAKFVLIDFEEVCISNKYNDYSTLVANWDLNLKNIKIIADENDLDIVKLVKLSIIWTGLIWIWNKNMFKKTSNEIFDEKMQIVSKRALELKKILNSII